MSPTKTIAIDGATVSGSLSTTATQLVTFTGVYTISLTPASAGAATYTATLSSAVTASTAVLGGNGSQQTIARAGQDGRLLTAAAVVGTRYSVAISATQPGLVDLIQPDGTVFGSFSFGVGRTEEDFEPVTVTGVYTVRVDLANNATGAYIASISSPLVGALSLTGPASTIALPTPGRDARYTFATTALGFHNIGVNALGAPSATVQLINPAGLVVVERQADNNYVDLDMSTLGITGTYTVRIDPVGALTGTYQITASTAVSAAIALGGANVSPALTRAGQDARYSLAGTAGQI